MAEQLLSKQLLSNADGNFWVVKWHPEAHRNLRYIYGEGPFIFVSKRYQYGSVTWGIQLGWIYTLNYNLHYIPEDSLDYRKIIFGELRQFEVHEMWLQNPYLSRLSYCLTQ